MAANAINVATDKWLSERSEAPLDRMKEWLMYMGQPLMERMGTALGGKRLLDEGGETAELVILGKLIASNAVELDRDIVAKVASVAELYSEAASRIEMRTGVLSELGHLVGPYREKSKVYQQILGMIKNVPEPPPANEVENDAMKFLKLRQAQAHVGLRAQVGGPMGTRRGLHSHSGLRLCMDDENSTSIPSVGSSQAPKALLPPQDGTARTEQLMQELFRTHDLKGDGVLDEDELITLNEKIAVLHKGGQADIPAVRSKFSHLFRTRLDPHGNPVPYGRFRDFMMQEVTATDPDPRGQEMIIESLLHEAKSALASFSNAQDPAMGGALQQAAGHGMPQAPQFGTVGSNHGMHQAPQFGAASYVGSQVSTASIDPIMAATSQDRSIYNSMGQVTPIPEDSLAFVPAQGVNQSISSHQSHTSQAMFGSKERPNIVTDSIGSRAPVDATTSDGYAFAPTTSISSQQSHTSQAMFGLRAQPNIATDSIGSRAPVGGHADPSAVRFPSMTSNTSMTNSVADNGTGDGYRVGDNVSIYSQSANDWMVGRVIKVDGSTVEIEYHSNEGARRKPIDLKMPKNKLAQILRRA